MWKTSHLQARLMMIPSEKVTRVEKRTNYLILKRNLTLSQKKRGKRENLFRKVLSLSCVFDRCSISMRKTAWKY